MNTRSSFAILLLSVLAMQATVFAAAPRRKVYCPPPCDPCPKNCPLVCPPSPDEHTPEMVPAETKPEDEKPAEVPETPAETNEDPFEPITNNFNNNNVQTAQASSVQSTTTPNMIGDFLSPGYSQIFSSHNATLPSPGATRLEIGQNNSPLPRNRNSFSYNHFHNAYTYNFSPGFTTKGSDSAHLDLFTAVFERTNQEGDFSLEFRVPVYTAPSSVQDVEVDFPDTNGYSTQLGNISLIGKKILRRNFDDSFVVSGGMGLTMPTGPGLVAYNDDIGVPGGLGGEVKIDNNSFKLTPFLALLTSPSPRVFMQGFGQLDINLNSNMVYYDRPANLMDPAASGSDYLNDQHILKLDTQFGYWLRLPDPASNRRIRGAAALFELHYATTLNNADTVDLAGFDSPVYVTMSSPIGNSLNRVDVLNVTMGMTTLIGDNSQLTFAVAAPCLEVQHGSHLFDHEFIIQYNYFLPKPCCGCCQ